MLVCTCGWIGINLLPDYERNTSLCPQCRKIFEGILACDAIYDENLDIINKDNTNVFNYKTGKINK